MTTLRRIWRLLDRRQRLEVVSVQLLALVMAVTTVGGIAAVAPFFAVLADPSIAEWQPWLRWLVDRFDLESSGSALATILGAGFVVAVLVSNLVNLFGSYISARIALGIGSTLQARLFVEYLHRPYVFHASANSAHLFNTVVYEASRLGKGVLQHAFLLGSSLATVGLIVVAMAALNPGLALTITGLLLAAYVGFYRLTQRQLRQASHEQVKLANLQAQTVTEGFAAIREVIVSSLQGYFEQRFARLNQGFVSSVARTQLVAQCPRHIMESVAAAAIVVSIIVIGHAQDGRGVLVAQVAFLGLATYRLLPALQGAYAAIVRIRMDGAALQEVVDVLSSARPAPAPIDTASAVTTWHGRPRHSIELKRVAFRYPGGRGEVLTGLSVVIPAHQVTGLSGPNGSGKTTLVDVVAGLLAPETGHVAVDGVSVDQSNLRAWQSVLAYVPQDAFLLDASIAENIAMGAAADQIDWARLRDAASRAQLDAWVSSLPHGYDEQIGDGGVRASGGQRQRIALARCLYRNASVIILDEATSSLDSAAERDVMQALAALRERCTIIVVSHRRSTLEHCDSVIELVAGHRRVPREGRIGSARRSRSFRRISGHSSPGCAGEGTGIARRSARVCTPPGSSAGRMAAARRARAQYWRGLHAAALRRSDRARTQGEAI